MNLLIAQIHAALARRERPLSFFLRDDDVSRDESSLRQLLTLCLRTETPINLAVIPGTLTQAGVALLNQYVNRHPEFMALNQHGWRHVNHENTGKKCEFGASRPADDQHTDLVAGKTRMDEAFGANWFPVFVPPWNRCTPTTEQLLAQLGFRALSCDNSHSPVGSLCKLPVTIDLHAWRGGAHLRPLDEFTNELVVQITHSDRIGLLLHHQVMDDTAFAWLEALLQTINRFPLVERHTFQSLLTDEQSSTQAS